MKNMIFFQIINVILSKCKGIKENCQEDKLSLKLFLKDFISILIADEKRREYHLIIFNSNGKKFRLLTDRKDIKIEEIIMLYASRWQIELIFRFMKRTVNGIHILNESENGLNIQFYIMAIANLVLLGFKQESLMMIKEKPISLRIENLLENPVSEIGNRLKQQWKLGKHWLRNLRNVLDKDLNLALAEVLAKCAKYVPLSID